MPTKKRGKKAPLKPKKPPGRPSLFTDTLADEICRRLHESDEGELPESLRQICRDLTMPALSTVMRWLEEDAGFRERYARARELRKDALIERLIFLAKGAKKAAYGDPGTGEAGARVQAYKIEIDALKWILSKEYARDYGDRITQEISGPDGGPVRTESDFRPTPEDEEVIRRIAETRASIKAAGAGDDA